MTNRPPRRTESGNRPMERVPDSAGDETVTVQRLVRPSNLHNLKLRDTATDFVAAHTAGQPIPKAEPR